MTQSQKEMNEALITLQLEKHFFFKIDELFLLFEKMLPQRPHSRFSTLKRLGISRLKLHI